MSKLTIDEISTLKLIRRSPDIGDGWRKVSKINQHILDNFGPKELIEIQNYEDEKIQSLVRFSERGLIVMDYI